MQYQERVVDVSSSVTSHFKYKSNIVYRLWLWSTKTNTGDPENVPGSKQKKSCSFEQLYSY